MYINILTLLIVSVIPLIVVVLLSITDIFCDLYADVGNHYLVVHDLESWYASFVDTI